MARRRWDDNEEAPKVKLTRESLSEALQMYKFIRPYRWSFWGGMMLLFLSTTTFMIYPSCQM